MTRRGELLEHHALVMLDGRILDVLPSSAAAERYAPRAVLDLPAHLLMPGLVNAYTRIGSLEPAGEVPQFTPAGGLLSIANMQRAGITCFCDVGYFPRHAAEIAAAQGMRALIGLPVAEHASPWAQAAGEYLTRALRLRDEYKGHPSISTGFAPTSAALRDDTYARLRTLADELDAGIFLSLHESQRAIDESALRHGLRPLERLQRLGLLTPALAAAHMVCLSEADIDLARRGGVGATLCLASNMLRGTGLPPVAALAQAELRLGLGSDGAVCGNAQDLWMEIKLLALNVRSSVDGALPWDALAAATRGGAAVLGLDGQIGTLEAGKWADVCAVDLSGPATQPLYDPLAQLVFSGGRDMVSDVWVAGRQLLCKGEFTRLDWPSLAAHLGSSDRD